jgi:hypothetical protein
MVQFTGTGVTQMNGTIPAGSPAIIKRHAKEGAGEEI